MAGMSDKFKGFYNDASFITDFIESLAKGQPVTQEFPDVVMLLGFLSIQVKNDSKDTESVKKASYKDFRKMISRITWDKNHYSSDLFQDSTARNIDNALNTPFMRAAYRVILLLDPEIRRENSTILDWRAWQIFLIVSGRPYYAALQVSIPEMYFQLDSPSIKPKQLLGKKICDGLLQAGISPGLELILMMLVCWYVEKKRKVEEPSITRRKGISMTAANVDQFCIAVKSFLNGWTQMAIEIFGASSLESLWEPFTLIDVKQMEIVVLREGSYSTKGNEFSVLHQAPEVAKSHCDYQEISERTDEENETIRKLAQAFFKSFWEAVEGLRTGEKTFEGIRKAYVPEEKISPKKGRIPVAVWKHLEVLSIVQPDSFLGPPPGMPTFASLPKHIVRHFVVCFQLWDWEERLQNLCLDEWPEEFQEKFAKLQSFSLLSVDEREFSVRVGPSTIPNSGLGVFAKRNLKKGSVVGWYTGTIVYRDIELDKNLDAVYGSVRFGCTVEQFKKYALEVNGSGVFLVAPAYCVAGKVNDPRALDSETSSHFHEPNCIFDSKNSEINAKNLKDPFLVTLKTSTFVKAGQELFVDYGEKYDNWK